MSLEAQMRAELVGIEILAKALDHIEGVFQAARPKPIAAPCPVSGEPCDHYEDCDNRNYCHIK